MFVKTLKLSASDIQNLQNAKFYSCQIKLVSNRLIAGDLLKLLVKKQVAISHRAVPWH